MSLVIGLTGGIASGKSTVAKMFAELGIPVIDADLEARYAVEKGTEAYNQIIETFGVEILDNEGSIDRAKLGTIIFNDKQKRLTLNGIVHPAVRKNMLDKKDAAIRNGAKLVVLDIPLLFESKLTHMVDKIIVVYVNEELQLKRLIDRNGYTMEEALSRINSQMPLREKKELADYVLDNNGSIFDTKQQLLKILRELS